MNVDHLFAIEWFKTAVGNRGDEERVEVRVGDLRAAIIWIEAHAKDYEDGYESGTKDMRHEAVEGIGKMILHLEELQESLGAGRCGA
jgi:hypothetical protein